MVDTTGFLLKGIVSPLLLWNGWEANKTEAERLREFLDYGHGLLENVEHLSAVEFEELQDLQCDLRFVSTSFGELQSTPALLRWTGHKKYASDLAALKARTEEVVRIFGQKLGVDTNRKITNVERFQRKVISKNFLLYLVRCTAVLLYHVQGTAKV